MERLSRAKLKIFTSLHRKKYRYRHGLFLVEGRKLADEALASGWSVYGIVVSEAYGALNELKANIASAKVPFFYLPETEFLALSQQSTPEGVLTVVEMPAHFRSQREEATTISDQKFLLLENVRDPGNLGTLIRSADWFGVRQIYARIGTADVFNEKTLRASMGSVFRVHFQYVAAWETLLQQYAHRIWLAELEGKSARKVAFGECDGVLIGSESHGVRPESRNVPGVRCVTLPGVAGAESLNAAVAGSILLYELGNAQ